MKIVNLILAVFLAITIMSCNGEKTKVSDSELSESIQEIEEILIDNEDEGDDEEYTQDESDYIEKAILSLQKKDKQTASSELVKAVNIMQTYTDEYETIPSLAEAIEELNILAQNLRDGEKMTAIELRDKIESLEYFSEDVDYDDNNFEVDEEEDDTLEEEFEEEIKEEDY